MRYHEIIAIIHVSAELEAAPLFPLQCWKNATMKLVLHESVLSTLYRGGEGQNV